MTVRDHRLLNFYGTFILFLSDMKISMLTNVDETLKLPVFVTYL